METTAVLALARAVAEPLLTRLVIASVLMIAFGHRGGADGDDHPAATAPPSPESPTWTTGRSTCCSSSRRSAVAPLALQRAVAGDLLRPRLVARLVPALPVAPWLCAADRLAPARPPAPVSPLGVARRGSRTV